MSADEQLVEYFRSLSATFEAIAGRVRTEHLSSREAFALARQTVREILGPIECPGAFLIFMASAGKSPLPPSELSALLEELAARSNASAKAIYFKPIDPIQE